MPTSDEQFSPAIFHPADLSHLTSATAALRRAVRSGSIVRIRRGAYVDASEWRALSNDNKYRALVYASAAALSNDSVFSHQSAAALWGLPNIGPWPSDVHVLVERASGGRSDPGIRRHALGLDAANTSTRDGVLVTGLARTVVDLAASAPLFSAVAAVDGAIHKPRYGSGPMLSKEELYAQWDAMMPFRGFARARRIIDFGETGAGSTSESASRVSIALLGFPAPQLQREFIVAGRGVQVDFYFPEVDAIGECDGLDKYLSADLRGGRSVEQVVLDEKYREDALRRQVSGFARWGSREAMTPSLLRVTLSELGLNRARPRISGS